MIEQKQCKFCEALQTHKNIRQFNNANFEPKLYEEYNVALVIRSWTKGNKRMAGRTTDYRYRGIGFKLNYCPECGRKVHEVSNNSPKVGNDSGELISRVEDIRL